MPCAARPGAWHGAAHPTLLEDAALPESRSPAEQRPRPASPRGGSGVPGAGGRGPRGAAGDPRGLGRAPPTSCRLSAETRVWGELGLLRPCCSLTLGGSGEGCVPARGRLRPPTPHLPPRAVTSSWGTDQTATPESWKGARPGGGGRRPREEPFPLYRVFQNILFMNRLT